MNSRYRGFCSNHEIQTLKVFGHAKIDISKLFKIGSVEKLIFDKNISKKKTLQLIIFQNHIIETDISGSVEFDVIRIMKATLILKSSSSSIIFFSADKAFLDHTKKKAVEEKMVENDVFQIEQIVVLLYGLPTIFINMNSCHSQIKGLQTSDNLNIQVTYTNIHTLTFFPSAFHINLIIKKN